MFDVRGRCAAAAGLGVHRARTQFRATRLIGLWLASAIACASLPLPEARTSTEADTAKVPGTLEVWRSERGISAHAVGVPLGDVLSRIAGLYGATLVLEGRSAESVSVSFRDLSLVEGLRRLARKAPFYIRYELDPVTGLPMRPSEIRIYRRAHRAPLADVGGAAVGGESPDTGRLKASAALDADRTDGLGLDPSDLERMADRGTAEDMDALGRIVAEHPDPEMRYLAVTVLGDSGDVRAALAIERGLGDEDPMLRSYAVATLGQLNVLDAVRSLGQVVFGERDPAIRLLAVDALKLRDEEPARAFLTAAASDPDPEVRRAAATALRSAR